MEGKVQDQPDERRELTGIRLKGDANLDEANCSENPLSLSYLNIPTIKGNFDGLKNVRFTGTLIFNHCLQILYYLFFITDDQAEIKASDASDTNIQHLKRPRKSNVVTYVLEEKYTGWLTCAILHSAPEYYHLKVTNFSSPRRTPFEVVEIENGARRAIYKDVTIKDVKAHGASIYLENEDRFYLKFSVLSTDRQSKPFRCCIYADFFQLFSLFYRNHFLKLAL